MFMCISDLLQLVATTENTEYTDCGLNSNELRPGIFPCVLCVPWYGSVKCS